MKSGGWGRSLVDAVILWMAIFPLVVVLANLARTHSLDPSGAGYFWAYAFRGEWSNILFDLAWLGLYIGVTAALLRFTGKKLFS